VTSSFAAGETALSRCVACGPDVFAADYWSRAPLLTRAAELPGGGFADLLDAAAVDQLVSERGLRTPFVRMAKDGSVQAGSAFTRGGGAGATVSDQVADDKVLRRMDDGSTLVLQGLHRTWAPIVRFASALSAELGHPLQVNAYITPPQSRGFAPHYDVHDVFVLQVAGCKQWTIHEPVVPDPLDSQNWERSRSAVADRARDDRPLIETVLEPGDALYLPRGTIHAAQALGEFSIHLTVGVHPLTRYTLVRSLLDLAERDAALRASLPVGVDLADPTVLEPVLKSTLSELHRFLDSVPAPELAERVGTALMDSTRPEPIGPLAQLNAAASLSAETPLRTRPGLRHRLCVDASGVVVTTLDRTLTLPRDTAAAVETALSGAVFIPGQLSGLDAADQLTLARRLLREGVIVPA
jgi:lysine-specific demethylase/histidyl-hydroxylase NO66